MSEIHYYENEHPRPTRLLGDTKQVAAMLGISERSVRRHVAERTFSPIGRAMNGQRGRPPYVFDLKQVADAWQARV
jgi:predicted ArsR family transcriptional regulator